MLKLITKHRPMLQNCNNYHSLRCCSPKTDPQLLHNHLQANNYLGPAFKRHMSITTSITNTWLTISQSTPVNYFQHSLIQLHDITGLPWWATIILSTIVLRTIVTMPLAIYQYKITAKVEIITQEMPAIVQELKKEAAIAKKRFNWTDQETRVVYNRSVKKQWNALIVRDNCHPMKTLIVLWGQIPLWIIQSVSLRNLITMMPDLNALEAKIAYTELCQGGFAFIPNLTECDASYIFPVTLGLLNLAIIEIQTMSRHKQATKIQKYATNFFRILSVGMVPIAASVPAGLSLYWTASSAYGLSQNLLLMSPKIRSITGIPKTPSQLEHPYKHLSNAVATRIDAFKLKFN